MTSSLLSPSLRFAVNYHHWGEAKRWYSVPSSSAEAFETAFKTALPELFEKQPDVLFHLVTMLSPRILQAAHIPVYSISQVNPLCQLI
jgi:histone demethylase JARID1